MFSDPQVKSLQMSRKAHHPELGDRELVAQGFNISGFSKDIRMPAPGVGEHNDQVLSELGLSEDEIDELRRTDVV
jgi:crotonobetainyl-CoA:carnitine CoA-transferase CaiB-like acyl-CoA transferase